MPIQGGYDDDYKYLEEEDPDLEDDIPVDIADEYDMDAELGTIDFSLLELKPKHENKPLWVCPNFHIYLDTASRYYEQATDFLTAIAEPLSRPQFIHEYYITDSSLYGAVSIGFETESIIKKLDSLSKVRLTTEMINHIRMKTETFGKVKLVLRKCQYRVEAKNETIKRNLLKFKDIDDCRLSDDEWDMKVEDEVNYDERPDNLAIMKVDPQLDDSLQDQPAEEEDEEKDRKRVSFPIRSGKETEVKKVALSHHYPMIEEYDYQSDRRNRTIRIHISPSTHIRPYQERCLNKMFGNGRARSGIIVLPCGAGKTIVGITAAVTIKKSCIVVCNSTLSALQWRDSFLSFCTVKDDCIRVLLKDKREALTNPCILLTTYYQLDRSRRMNKEREAILNEIAKREWGLLVLDEVHVCPADSFQKVVSTVKAHCKLGLTATLVREDEKIKNLDYLIGPKLYEANWMDLTNKGYLSPVKCLEVWCDMNPLFYEEFLRHSREYNRQKLLAVVNPEKVKALAYLLHIHKKRG